MNTFNPAHFHTQFPALADTGVYLDSTVTALKPQAVIDANGQFYHLSVGDVRHGQFAAAQWLTEHYETARGRVAAWLSAPSGKDIVWTRGTTKAINMVARSYIRPRLQPGNEITVSGTEHHANLVPWLMVTGQTGVKVIKLPLDVDRLPNIASLNTLITLRNRVLAIGQMSSATGGCPDLAQAIRLARATGMVVMVDGAQDAVHFPANVQALDIDFYAFSGHKLYGPAGIGALYGKSELLAAVSPWLGGGKMIAEVSFDDFTPQPAPYGLEAGMPNVARVIGLGAVLGWLAQSDIGQAENWSRSLTSLAGETLAERPDFRSFRYQQSSLPAFEFDDVHHNDLVTLLAESDIALRAGQRCAQPLLAALGISDTLRTSFAPYNTQDGVTVLVRAVGRVLEILVD